MRILLAIDGSGHSEAAIHAVASRRFREASVLRVISVVDSVYPMTFGGEGVNVALFETMEHGARDRARAAVEKAAGTLRASDQSGQLTVTTEVLSGSPKLVILDAAEALDADVIVVGSHGHGMVSRFLLGSVSQAVALHAGCSVEIVRTRPTRKTEGDQ